MAERYPHSPTEQNKPQFGLLERAMLRRISRLGLLLPDGEFSGQHRKSTVQAEGRRSPYHTVIKLTQALPHEGESVERITNIQIDRDTTDLFVLTGLQADTTVIDDVAQTHQVPEVHQHFSLDSYENELSVSDLMNYTNMAVKAVRRKQAPAPQPVALGNALSSFPYQDH